MDETLSYSTSTRPREECGVFAVYGHEDAARVAFFGLFALQHRGQESAGIAVADGCQVLERKGMGLVSEVFREDILPKLPGHLAIGHVRYSTTGSSVISNAQPFLVHHGNEYYALAHNGNLVNAHALRVELEDRGSIFQSTMDSEVVVHLLAAHLKNGLEEALVHALGRIEGAYSIVMLTRERVIAARDPRGFRPLSLGQFNGGWVIASETARCEVRREHIEGSGLVYALYAPASLASPRRAEMRMREFLMSSGYTFTMGTLGG